MIARQILQRAGDFSGHTAIVTGHGRWTYGELARYTLALASRLDGCSGHRDTVAIAMTNRREVVAALLAANLGGHLAVLLGPGLRPDETRSTIRSSGARLLLVMPADLQDPGLTEFVPAHDVSNRDELLVLPVEPAPRLSTALPVDAFVAQLTSGSMGSSRLAVRSVGGVRTEIDAVTDRLGLTAHDRIVCASSIAHSYALVGGLLGSLGAGATVVLAPRPGEPIVPGMDIRPTLIFGLAATYQALLTLHLESRTFLSDVRWMLSAGAPLPAGLFEAFRDRFGVPIRQDYGSTETGTVSIDSGVEASPGTVGEPLPHLEVAVRSDEIGLPGEILVRSPAVAVGYIGPGGIESCTDAGGWYHTGDLGTQAHGMLQLAGRVRPPIVLDAGAVDPRTVEGVLLGMPGVDDAAVAAAQSTGGEIVLKAVVVTGTRSEDEVRAWCHGRLPAAHIPRIIEFRDALPTSPAGKLLRKYL